MDFNFRDFMGRVRQSAVASNFIDTVTSSLSRNGSSSVVEVVDAATVQDVERFLLLQGIFDDRLVIYGPVDITNQGLLSKKKFAYNVMLRQPNTTASANVIMFCLFKTNDVQEATTILGLYRNTIGELASLDFSVYDKTVLDKICARVGQPDSLGWTPLHVAAAFDLAKQIGSPTLQRYVNQRCESKFSRTPLHLAIVHQSFAVVWELLNSRADINAKDGAGNTVIHLAIESTVPILALLLERLPEKDLGWMNEVNRDGGTAFQTACQTDKSEVVKELITRYPQLLKLKNADGGSPLHWAGGTNTFELLLSSGCESSIANNLGETPLHSAVRRGCLKSVICLMCHSAPCDTRDNDGETPLHIAARSGLKNIIKVLIVFGANLNILNNRGETPRHIVCAAQVPEWEQVLFLLSAVEAERCPQGMANQCTAGCRYADKFQGTAPPGYKHSQTPSMMETMLQANSVRVKYERNVEKEKDGRSERMLCLDGGGIRGIVLTQILLYIEQVCGHPTLDLFDWIAGTSTGGILALGIATGKPVSYIQGLYLRLKDRVFIGDRPYKSEALDEFLKQEFGLNAKMSSIKRPKLMITSARVDQIPADFHLFRNYDSPRALLGEKEITSPSDDHIWECAKRTGAAPSFFRLEGRFIDGGLISNNPTLDALTEMVHFKTAFKSKGEEFQFPTVLVSLGTGLQPAKKCNASHLDICWPSTIRETVTTLPRILTLVNLLVDQATQAEGQVVERARAWCSSIGMDFFRFSPQMSAFVDLDEKNDETLVHLMWETRVYMVEHKEYVKEIRFHLTGKTSD